MSNGGILVSKRMMDLLFGIPTAHAGVITEAPRVTSILANVLEFLLSIVGIVAIIGLVIAGLLYFFAGGDQRRIELAKTMSLASVIGLIIALGAMVVIRQIASFFS